VFEIKFYELSSGRKPAKDFILSLAPKMQVKAYDSLEILQEWGNALREPYSKPMGDGVFELRIKFAGDITRLFYFFHVGKTIVVTNGFIKKTGKTPRAQIELAKKYKKEYYSRKSDE